MKKAQMEIVGLMLIAVIAGLVIVFAIVFSSSTDSSELIHETFSELELSSSFVTAISEIYVPECKADYSTLVRDCASEFQQGLANQGRISCGGILKSCDYVNITSKEILEDTLEMWNVNYRYRVLRENLPDTIVEFGKNCNETSSKEEPGRQIIPLYPLPEQAYIILEICK